jgi:hypothetical protein
MKKITLFFILLFQLVNSTEKDSLHLNYSFSKYYYLLDDDCDACGCSASGGSMGFASMLNSNFVGIRYFNQQYQSTDGLYTNSLWYTENFTTTQIWARIPVKENIQVSVLLPYQSHNRETATGSQAINGIGDITLLAMYRLYQTKTDSTYFAHTLQMGGGVKMPTGKFNEANSGAVNPSFQVGTGSWDYLLATEYIVRRKQFGLNTLLNYVIKTENQKNYRFGNQLNYAGTFFYLYEKDALSFAPQVGIAGELYESNFQYGERLNETSGNALFGKIGFEVGRNAFSFGANVMLPIQQNLTGGNVEANYRWSINLNYSL